MDKLIPTTNTSFLSTTMMNQLVTFITIVSLLLFSLTTSQAQDKDSCENLFYASRGQSVTPSQVKKCYEVFPYNPVIAAKTIRVFENVFEFYAFYDISQDTPEPHFQPNVYAQPILERLRGSTYKNDWEFQRALNRALTPYNDGHFWYTPNCYTQFEFLQPFFLAAIWNRQKTSIFIQSVDTNLTFAQSWNKFTNAEVLKINGAPVLKYLQDFGDHAIGVSKDSSTRLQATLSFKTWDQLSQSFKIHRGGFSYRTELPENDHVEYTIRLPSSGEVKSIKVPWTGRPVNSTLTWTNKDEYWRVHCLPKTEDGIESTRSRRRHHRRPIQPFERFMNKGPSDSVLQPRLLPQPEAKLIANHTGISIHLIKGEKTSEPVAVLSMTEFPWASEEWRRVVLEGLKEVKKQGARKLILDMSNNGGGYLCTYHLMLKLLTPKSFRPFVTDLRLSPGIKKLIETAYNGNYTESMWLPTWWVNGKTGKLYNDSSVLKPMNRILPHGKAAVSSSQQFYEYCDWEWPIMEEGEKIEIAPKDMVVLTNGFCGSSCALFTFHLKEQSGVRTVAVSPTGSPSTFFTFPGSEVYDTDYLVEDVRLVGLTNDPKLNFQFPSRATLSFPFRQAWSHDGQVLEYHAKYADVQMKWSSENVLQPVRLWREVAKKLWRK